ncbi:MAG: hypothetical protein UX26_C0026G0010 [Parcubacteria group bacterium GW2011_GWC1_45_9]|nr:MAG: hypothetical protein UW85_C0003G0049 [Parcubacteria group bacterium GW2011_GWA1_Parcubacteria_45_10]KKT87815.1 MAG: hypothetical protein UW89_C0017G0007 [Parcubacteria group bacterium GW2011_GWB1_45_10]KKU16357.1 MAG: hypothetical protein UX26_C0026G0010 [Parcubacteria group bacterium GW2011_GWC1_45_9]HCI05686.1 hypothetical protein [Patescibacteria group bacterium]
MRRGQSTLEILVALSVLIISVSAAISVFFSNQLAAEFSSRQHQALQLAEQEIEVAKARAVDSFDSLVSQNSSFSVFQKEMIVENLDFYTKKITSRVSWLIDSIRPANVSLTTVLTNWRAIEPDDGTGPGSGPVGDWMNPETAGTLDLGAGNEGTDLAVKDEVVFITAKASDNKKKDLLSINVSNIYSPQKISEIDTGYGLNSIFVLNDYAYVVQAKTSNQFQIINIANPASMNLVGEITLSGAGKQGLSVAVKDNFAFVGTEKSSGKELYVFNVSNAASPQLVKSIELGANIQDIHIFNDRAYLATNYSTSSEAVIFDIVNPANPVFLASFDCLSSCGSSTQGLSVFPANYNTLFLGTNFGLEIINTANLSGLIRQGGYAAGGSVNDIYAVDFLAFLATSNSNTEFQVVDITNLQNPYIYSSFNFPQMATGIAYRNNVVYTSVRSNDALRIITSTP